MIIPICKRGKVSHQPTTATRWRELPFLWRKNAYSTWWQVAMKWWKTPRRRVVTASLRQQHIHMPFHPFGPSEAAMIRQPFASSSLRLLRLIDPGSMHWPLWLLAQSRSFSDPSILRAQIVNLTPLQISSIEWFIGFSESVALVKTDLEMLRSVLMQFYSH
jgi:hypothetical protein